MKKFLLAITIVIFGLYNTSSAQWVQTNGPYGGKITALAINSTGHIFAGTFQNGIYRSTDNGNTWVQMNNHLIDLGLENLCVTSIAINQADNVYISSSSGVYRTTDNGNTWAQMNNGLTNTYVYLLGRKSSGHVSQELMEEYIVEPIMVTTGFRLVVVLSIH